MKKLGPESTRGDVFVELLLAAMHDAAVERKLTQFKSTITPPGKKEQLVRIIVVPDSMDMEWPRGLGK